MKCTNKKEVKEFAGMSNGIAMYEIEEVNCGTEMEVIKRVCIGMGTDGAEFDTLFQCPNCKTISIKLI